MLFFIVTIGYAVQCYTNNSLCSQVPLDAVNEMVKLGILELLLEVGGYKYYTKRYKKGKDD
jgi:hypothetical protein